MSGDDMLKIIIVLVIGTILGYCSRYILPEEEIAGQPSQIVLFDVDHIETTKTNVVLNIPVIRIGSGIR